MTTLHDFSSALDKHDWLYEYSDDPTVYRRGLSERDAIKRMLDELNRSGFGDTAREMYSKALKENMPCWT